MQDRYQREQDAWEGMVGNQTPAEFWALSQENGCTTILAATRTYVIGMLRDQPFGADTMTTIEAHGGLDEAANLLAGYIQRHT